MTLSEATIKYLTEQFGARVVAVATNVTMGAFKGRRAHQRYITRDELAAIVAVAYNSGLAHGRAEAQAQRAPRVIVFAGAPPDERSAP